MKINETFRPLPFRPPIGPLGMESSTTLPTLSSDSLTLSAQASIGVAEQTKTAEALPQSLPSKLGGTEYYVARAEDFKRRHPDMDPPSYYLGYGNKYVHRFTEQLAPQLSPAGQEWLAKARLNLQLAMERKLQADPEAFDRLEQDEAEFQEFAYETHPQAYLDAGMDQLPLKDLVKIGKTPDVRDLFTFNGLEQVADVAAGLAARKARRYLAKGLTWKLPKLGADS